MKLKKALERFEEIAWESWAFSALIVTGLALAWFKAEAPSLDLSLGQKVKNPTSSSLFASAALPSELGSLVDLGCLGKSDQNMRLTAKEGLLRIRAEICDGLSRSLKSVRSVPTEVSVKNLTNGYEGTIFFGRNNRQFTTDFIVLQAGKNVIEVSWLKPGDSTYSQFKTEVYQR